MAGQRQEGRAPLENTAQGRAPRAQPSQLLLPFACSRRRARTSQTVPRHPKGKCRRQEGTVCWHLQRALCPQRTRRSYVGHDGAQKEAPQLLSAWGGNSIALLPTLGGGHAGVVPASLLCFNI